MQERPYDSSSARKINYVYVSSYFTLRDFQSPDTETVKIDPKVLRCLDKLQRMCTDHIVVTSGYRTPAHNEKVGGAKRSYHMRGMAVDCYQADHYGKDNMVALAKRGLEAGFGTAIVYKGHVHFDVRQDGLGLRYNK